MPIEAAQNFFRLGDSISQLEVFVRNPDELQHTRLAIGAAIGPNHRLYDWQQANSSLFNALQVERNVLFLILTLIILVAAFNIVSSLIMLVKDKGSRSEEHTSELQSLMRITYAVFCWKKK